MLQEAKQATAAASPGLESLELSTREVKEVEELLRALDREIVEVSAEIGALKMSGTPEVWREEVVQLRRDEEQLRRKEEQLRNEELFLMRRVSPE